MTVFIDPKREIGRIDPKLHGQFIEFLGECIDEGLWVGEDSPIENEGGYRKATLDALRALKPPLIRWPGGCYADTYHWRDGVGPRKERPTTFNENFATYELDDHAFGTDEFLRLCEMLGAEPWININMLSGTVAEMKDWMEYCNREQPTDLARERAANGHEAPYGVKYWGIGNEVWAGGGTMTPSTYLDESVYVFASKTADGKSLLVDLTNAHMNDAAEVMLAVPAGARVEAMRELASADPHDCNTAEETDLVRARSVDVGDRVAVHAGAGATGEITVRLAPASVNTLRIAP